MFNPLRFITGRLRFTTSLVRFTFSPRPSITAGRTAGKAVTVATTETMMTTIGMKVGAAATTATAMVTVGPTVTVVVTLLRRSTTSANLRA